MTIRYWNGVDPDENLDENGEPAFYHIVFERCGVIAYIS
jgi:hypothetical protein